VPLRAREERARPDTLGGRTRAVPREKSNQGYETDDHDQRDEQADGDEGARRHAFQLPRVLAAADARERPENGTEDFKEPHFNPRRIVCALRLNIKAWTGNDWRV